MTDREIITKLLIKISGNQTIYVDNPAYIEIQNSFGHESICFEFDEAGNLLEIYS